MRQQPGSIAFGPVPSRRLGQSLGINNIPAKSCTYSCIYCQVGLTSDMSVTRRGFYKVEDILAEVERKKLKAQNNSERIDYLTFVSQGEPTLDINLGKEIEKLKSLGLKLAVITNSSLLWEQLVQDSLSLADWVSVKIDSVRKDIWHKVNRPHKAMDLGVILKGISDFSKVFKGVLVTETMLVKGINDDGEDIKKLSHFISGLKCEKSYVSIPSRPPAEKYVNSPDPDTINRAYQFFVESGINAELLIGYEGNSFAFTGDVNKDLLGIMAVHPMKEEAIRRYLNKAGSDWLVVEDLVKKGDIVKVPYRHQKFYVRKV